MLGRIGIGKIFIIVSTACALLVEVLRVTSFKEEAGRSEGGMLQINAVLFHTEQVDSLHVASDISVMWVWPQYIFFSIAELFCNITGMSIMGWYLDNIP